MSGQGDRQPKTRKAAAGGPERRARWQRDPEGKRLRILDAAVRLAGERGYTLVRTSDIARSAGVSEGTIFHQFGTKNGLFVAVAENYAQGFLDAMFDDFDPGAANPDIESVFRRAFAYVRHSAPEFGAFLMAANDSSGRSARAAYRERIVGRLTQSYATWMKRGIVRKTDPAILAELSFGVVETALRECYTRDKRDRESAYIAEVVATIRGMTGLAD
jgi:AcrR family transcriptional regulator